MVDLLIKLVELGYLTLEFTLAFTQTLLLLDNGYTSLQKTRVSTAILIHRTVFYLINELCCEYTVKY